MSGDARIHFVRHAETLFNVNNQLQGWCDAPLTPRGERQAEALGEYMRDVPLAAAFMSDLTRTRTTMAAALVGHPLIEPTPMRDLREWNFGGMEGQPNSALWTPVFAELGYSYAARDTDWAAMTDAGFDDLVDAIHRNDPTGRADTAATLNARLESGLRTVVDAAHAVAYQWDVLVVTHGSVLSTILRHLVPTHRGKPGFPNCGVVTVTFTDGAGAVGEVVDSCSLPELA